MYVDNVTVSFRALNMEYKAGFLVITLLVGCFAFPTPEDDLSMYFEHTDVNARIVGGSVAAEGAHPHMVAMTNGLLVRGYVCGGSVITSRTVLTAAHCIAAVFSFGALSSNLRVTIGTNRWNTGGSTLAIARNVTHPNYDSGPIKNDIGILITTADIPFSQQIQPIPLTYEYIGGGVPSIVAGWGRIVADRAHSATLLEINVDTLGGEECRELVEQAKIDLNRPDVPSIEPHIEVCTYHSPGLGTCNGDSGSALARVSDGRQIGIVSWGFSCALGAPDIFVRVGGFQNFLEANVV